MLIQTDKKREKYLKPTLFIKKYSKPESPYFKQVVSYSVVS